MTPEQLEELRAEIPAIRSYYAGSVLRTVEEDINRLCDAVIAAAEREAKLREALEATQTCVKEMLGEHKLHGHITDAKVKWHIHVEPLIEQALAENADGL